jgi:drug/metabolite transporter (DMT)-like permease
MAIRIIAILSTSGVKKANQRYYAEVVTKKAWFLFAAMAFIWGIPYLLIRVAVRELHPGQIVVLRTLPASLLLLPLVLYRREFSLIIRHWRWILTFGVVEFGIPWYCMSTAEEHLTSSFTSLVICGVPLITIFAARFTSAHEQLTARRISGLAIGAVGVGLLVGLDLGHGAASSILMLIVVCVGYAVGPLILQTKLTEVPGPAIVCGATGMVALGWLPYFATHVPHRLSAETWQSIAVLSVLCTAVAFLVFFALVKEAGSGRSLVVVYSNTAIAILLGVLFLHEPLTIGILLGFPMIVAGSYLGTTATRGSTPPDADAHLFIDD